MAFDMCVLDKAPGFQGLSKLPDKGAQTWAMWPASCGRTANVSKDASAGTGSIVSKFNESADGGAIFKRPYCSPAQGEELTCKSGVILFANVIGRLWSGGEVRAAAQIVELSLTLHPHGKSPRGWSNIVSRSTGRSIRKDDQTVCTRLWPLFVPKRHGCKTPLPFRWHSRTA